MRPASARRLLGMALAAFAAMGSLAPAARAAEGALSAPLSARASIEPREHFFADRVVARVEVTVDRRAVDPDAVRLLGRFAPYRRTGEIQAARRDLDETTVLVYTVTLQCIDRACLRGAGRSAFRLPPAVVQYYLRADPAPVGVQARWPVLTMTHRLAEAGAGAPVRGAVLQPPAVSYRIPPTLLGSLLAVAAAALALGAVAAAAVRLRPRRPRPRPDEERAPLGLEDVLALVERAPDDDARRMALDLLARSLSGDGTAALAGQARRLAWAASPPARGDLQRLADEVRRLEDGR